MAIPETPRRSQPRTGHNPDLHAHRDNSSGGRIHAIDLLGVEELTATQDHGLLLGLSDDDHSQYWLLAGRSGNTVAYGGTLSGGTAKIVSTSHATKGKVIFGAAGTTVYDEVNERVGINIDTPTARLHVKTVAGSVYGRPTATVSNQFGLFGAATAHECIDEESQDASTTYIEHNNHAYQVFSGTFTGSTFSYSGASTGFKLRCYTGRFSGDSATRTWQNRMRLETAGGLAITANHDWNSSADSTYEMQELALTPAECADLVTANSGAGWRFYFETQPGGFGGITSELRLTQIEVEISTGGSGTPLAYFDQASTHVASISIDGQGQFQNVALEDPGAGTGTVTLKAPSGVTSWAMTMPADDGSANEVLATDGSGVTDWVAVASLLDADLTAIAALTGEGILVRTASNTWALTDIAQGDVFYGSAADTLTALAKNTSATRYLSNTGSSNNPAWAQVALDTGVSGDLPFANLTQGSALSVLGVTGNSTNDVASIAAGTDHQVLRRSGTALAFGAVNLASADAVTGTLAVANGGTGGTGGVDVARTWTTLQTFGSGTWESLELSGGFTASDSVIPNFNTTYNSGTGTRDIWQFTDADDSNPGTGFTGTFSIAPGTMTASQRYYFPITGGTLPTTTSTDTLSNKTLAGAGGIRCGTSTGTSMKFQNQTSTTQFAMFDMTNLTAQRNVTFPNLAGVLLLSESVIFNSDEIVSWEDEIVALTGT